MKSEKIIADFQLRETRVSQFKMESYLIDEPITSQTLSINYDFDYDINVFEPHEENAQSIGVVAFIVNVKATNNKKKYYTIKLRMEGLFTANKNIDVTDFQNMLELNGLISLTQLARTYLLSVTQLSNIKPPVYMPMINIYKLKELKKAPSEKQ